MRNPIPDPPPNLTAASQALWRDILGRKYLEAEQRMVLSLALEACDGAKRARRAVAKEGATIKTKRGSVVMNPQIRIQRDFALTFSRLMSTLGLAQVDPTLTGRRRPQVESSEDPAAKYLDS